MATATPTETPTPVTEAITGEIRGTLVQKDSLEPISDVEMELELLENTMLHLPTGITTKTDSSSNFWFKDVPLGEYVLSIRVPLLGTYLYIGVGLPEEETPLVVRVATGQVVDVGKVAAKGE